MIQTYPESTIYSQAGVNINSVNFIICCQKTYLIMKKKCLDMLPLYGSLSLFGTQDLARPLKIAHHWYGWHLSSPLGNCTGETPGLLRILEKMVRKAH